MNIFSRLSQMIAANLHGLLDKAEDPGLALQQVIREMNDELISQRRQLAEATANYRLTETEYRRYSNAAQLYNGHFIAYSQRDQQSEAMQAANFRDDCLHRATALLESAKIQAQSIQALTRNLQQIEAKCSEANNRKQELLTKASVAKSQEKMQSANSVFAQFDRLEQLISVKSEQAIAYSEISSSSRTLTISSAPSLNPPALPPAAQSIPAMPEMPQMPAIPRMPAMPSMPSFDSFGG
jgi:phage shock protein A